MQKQEKKLKQKQCMVQVEGKKKRPTRSAYIAQDR
jgi:hypothetical protein